MMTTIILSIFVLSSSKYFWHHQNLHDSQNDDKCLWYFDNGASKHMFGCKEKFLELEENVKGNVSFGDSSKVKIQGKGTILISLKDGSR